MTNKKRITISLSDENYEYLINLIGVTMNLDGKRFTIATKSEAIEKILKAIKEKDQEYDKPKK